MGNWHHCSPCYFDHPQSYHDPNDEPIADALEPSFFDFDYGEELSKDQLKGQLRLNHSSYYFLFVDVDEHKLSRADIPRSHETPTTRLSAYTTIVMISRYHGRTNHNRRWTLCFRSYPRTERSGREEQEGEGSWIYGLILRSSGILDKQHSTILFFYCCFLLLLIRAPPSHYSPFSTPFFLCYWKVNQYSCGAC